MCSHTCVLPKFVCVIAITPSDVSEMVKVLFAMAMGSIGLEGSCEVVVLIRFCYQGDFL